MDISNLGSKLKALRDAYGKTQEDIAREIHIEQSTYANYEMGKRIPKIDILVRLSNYFGVPTDYLLGTNIFENWQDIIGHKKEVLEIISSRAARMSSDLLHGIDDITFIKLVYAFNIKVTSRDDGVGIDATDPIPTFSEAIVNTSPCATGRSTVNPPMVLSPADEKFLNLFQFLDEPNKDIIIGDMQRYVKEQRKEMSVAADKIPRKVSGK